MSLFIVEKLKVMPHPSTLLIYPFKDMWEADTTVNKDVALLKFAYIEFMCSYDKSNDFIGYEIEDRPNKIIAAIDRNNEYSFMDDNLIAAGIKMYKELQNDASPSIRLYEASLNASDKLVTFFDTLNMAERTKSGTPVFKPADITRALKDVNDVLKTLSSLKTTIHQELIEAAKGKGGRTINFFEKSINER
jgi:hypothetical protein